MILPITPQPLSSVSERSCRHRMRSTWRLQRMASKIKEIPSTWRTSSGTEKETSDGNYPTASTFIVRWIPNPSINFADTKSCDTERHTFALSRCLFTLVMWNRHRSASHVFLHMISLFLFIKNFSLTIVSTVGELAIFRRTKEKWKITNDCKTWCPAMQTGWTDGQTDKTLF